MSCILEERYGNLKFCFLILRYRHSNLVPLLGFSCDTDNHCLVYEFMSNGSLLDKLQMKNFSSTPCDSRDANKVLNGMASNCGNPSAILSEKALTWTKRIEIALDVCEGIYYLHTSRKFPLIHRDIKSANILLDDRLNGKVNILNNFRDSFEFNNFSLLWERLLGNLKILFVSVGRLRPS